MAEPEVFPPLRIWHFNVGNHAGAVDGVAVMSTRLANAQSALGHDVTYFATPPSSELGRQLDALAPGVTAVVAPSVPAVLVRALRSLVGPRRPDVVHFHSVYRPAHVVVWVAATVLGVVTVQSPHSGLAPERLAVDRVRKELYGVLLERWIHHVADVVFALQEVEVRDVVRYARRRRPVEVISNAVESEVLTEAPWEGGEEPPVAVLLARHDVFQKGLDRLAELAERLPSVRFRVHGATDKNQPHRAEQLASRAPENFSLEGPLYGAAKYGALREARCFVMPSRVEGVSLALLEAMALGVPCVVSDYVDASMGLSADGAAVALTGDADRDAAMLADLVADTRRLAAVGAAGRARVHSSHTPDAVARRSIECYRRAVSRRRSGRFVSRRSR